MSDQRGIVREISWRDLCPWLLLFRTFRLAVSLPLITLGTLAAVLIPLGWRGAEQLFLGDVEDPRFAEIRPWVEYRRAGAAQQFDRTSALELFDAEPLTASRFWAQVAVTPLYREGLEPFVLLFRSRRFDLRTTAYLLTGSVWTLLVWGWFGGAISRASVVRLGCEQAVGFREALRFSGRRLRSYVLAPLLPLFGVAAATLPGALIGLAMRADWGLLAAGSAWLLLLLSGLASVLLLAGVGFGWPLMWGAISAEPDGDEFEALNRAFSFALGRPLHYLFYVLVASLIGIGGSLVVDVGARSTIAAARWSASWGAGEERWSEIETAARQRAQGGGGPESGAADAGLAVIDACDDLARAVAVGFRHAFFWCAAGGVYLLLRRDVDDAELDDVFLEDLEPAPVLPPLELPSAAVPPPGASAGSATAGGADQGASDAAAAPTGSTRASEPESRREARDERGGDADGSGS